MTSNILLGGKFLGLDSDHNCLKEPRSIEMEVFFESDIVVNDLDSDLIEAEVIVYRTGVCRECGKNIAETGEAVVEIEVQKDFLDDV